MPRGTRSRLRNDWTNLTFFASLLSQVCHTLVLVDSERAQRARGKLPLLRDLVRMSWHSTGRWAVDARGFTQPLTTPMDLEYSSLCQNMRNAPSWWSPQRLSLLEQPDNFSTGQIRGSTRQLESTPKPAFGIPASAGNTGMLRGNFEGVVMGLRTEGRPFQPLKTPAAIMVNPSHFARFPAMNAPKVCRTRRPSRASNSRRPILILCSQMLPPAVCATRRFLLVPALPARQGVLTMTTVPLQRKSAESAADRRVSSVASVHNFA